MLLATTTVEDYDRFKEIFSTKGPEKRREHGSKGAQVFRDPNQDDRVWVLFDWDAEGWQNFVSDPEVPPIMKEAGHKGPPQVARARRPIRGLATEHSWTPSRSGVITDQTGPLSFMGIANANVAKMVIDDINDEGGLLGRQLELHLEDSATDDSAAEAAAAKLVKRGPVDVVFGGIYSSSRQAIKGPAVVEGKKLYIYPEQYEGQECDPLIFCTGPVPAQQVEPLIPWLMEQTGAKKFFLPSADYIWPHVLNEKVREVATANGGEIVGEEYFPIDHADYAETIEKIMASGADVVFNTIVPPGLMPFLEQLHDSGFTKRGGQLVCTYFDENLLDLLPGRARRGAVRLPRLLPERGRSVQQGAARPLRRAVPRQRQVHRRQRVLRACTAA